MPSNAEERASSPDVLSARHDVEVAKAELESRFREVRQSGEKALANVARKARPVLIVVAVAVGALVVVRVVRSAAGRRRATRAGRWEPPRPPSLLGIAFGAALRAAVRIVATRIAERAVLRLSAADESDEVETSAPTEFAAEVSTASAK